MAQAINAIVDEETEDLATFFEGRMMIEEIVDEIIYQVITGKSLEFPGGEVEEIPQDEVEEIPQDKVEEIPQDVLDPLQIPLGRKRSTLPIFWSWSSFSVSRRAAELLVSATKAIPPASVLTTVSSITEIFFPSLSSFSVAMMKYRS